MATSENLAGDKIYEASGLQVLNWNHQRRLDLEQSVFQEPEILSLSIKFRDISFSAFEKAYRDLVERHDILRTTFFEENGTLWQKISPYKFYFYDTGVFDISALAVKDEYIKEQTREAINCVCRLEKGPLIKSMLFKVTKREFWLVCIIHHIISDAKSLDIIKKELVGLYRVHKYGHSSGLPSIDYNVAEHSRVQNEFVTGNSGHRQHAFWMAKFQKYPLLSFLDFYQGYAAMRSITGIEDIPAGQIDTNRFLYDTPVQGANSFRYFFSAEISKRLNEVARYYKVTPFVFMTACFGLLFKVLNNQDMSLMATSVNDRRSLRTQNLVGHLMCKIYLDIQITAGDSVAAMMMKVYEVFIKAFRHPIYQEKQYEGFNVPKYTSLYLNYSDMRSNEMNNGQPLNGSHEKANRSCYALSAVINNYSNCIEFNWLYDTDVFTPGMIECMQRCYCNLVGKILQEKDITVAELVADQIKVNLLKENRYENNTVVLDETF